MNNEDCWAKPGDTIRITKSDSLLGKTLLVVECPKRHKNGDLASRVWVNLGEHEDEERVLILSYEKYEIVKRGNECVSTHSVVIDTDESLKRQRDDNLRHAFGY